MIKAPFLFKYFGINFISRENRNLIIALVRSKKKDSTDFSSDEGGYRYSFYYPSLRRELATLLSEAYGKDDKEEISILRELITETSAYRMEQPYI